MMYLILNLCVLGIIFACDEWILKTKVWRRKPTWIIFGALLVMTLVFDTGLTALPVVEYDPTKLLGLKIGTIPIEDLGYTLAVVILVPLFTEVYRDR